MRMLRLAALGIVLAGASLLPRSAAAQEPAGPDTVVFEPNRGKVTFAHGAHGKAFECASCHHASKAEKPATEGKKEKCSACHTSPATEPMSTTLKAAMHNTAAREGICFDCHKKEAEAGKKAPVTCGECHIKPD